MQAENPYRSQDNYFVGGATGRWLTRYRFCAIAFSVLVVSSFAYELSAYAQAFNSLGSIRVLYHALPSVLIHTYLIVTSVLLLLIEIPRRGRGMGFLPFILAFPVVLSFWGVFSLISSFSLVDALFRTFESPDQLLLLTLCPLIWYYAWICFLRFRVRQRVSGEPDDASESPS